MYVLLNKILTNLGLEVVAWLGLLLWPDTCPLWSLAQHPLLCPWEEHCEIQMFNWPSQHIRSSVLCIPFFFLRYTFNSPCTSASQAGLLSYLAYLHTRTHAPTYYTQSPKIALPLPSFSPSLYPLTSMPSAASLSLFFSYLPSSFFLSFSPPAILPSPAGIVCWLNIWMGGCWGLEGLKRISRGKAAVVVD